MQLMNFDKKNAFTLIELLVVIVIIGILSTISVALYSDYEREARIAAAASTLREIEKAINAYLLGEGEMYYPDENLADTDNDNFVSTKDLGLAFPELADMLPSFDGAFIGDGVIGYDNDMDTFACGGTWHKGVNLYIRSVSREDALALGEIFDGDGVLNCGKIHFHDPDNDGIGGLHYKMSRRTKIGAGLDLD